MTSRLTRVRSQLTDDGIESNRMFEKKTIVIVDDTPDNIALIRALSKNTCNRLNADERMRHIPVIFLTAMTQVENEQKGLELGADDWQDVRIMDAK